ncbi:MAG: MFS transporter [Maricaulaceae bacterium]
MTVEHLLTSRGHSAQARAFPAYLAGQASWFAGFGLQTALFPFIALMVVGVSAAQLGGAQTALTAPALVLVVFGGAIAERFDRARLLVLLQATAAVPPAVLATLLAMDDITLGHLIAYALSMGAIGAVMIPTRDAALNAVALHAGRELQNAVIIASGVQFAGQIAGLGLVALAASTAGVGAAALLAVQSGILVAGAIAAARLPALPAAPGADQRSIARQIGEGFAIVATSPVLSAMTLVMTAVGVFVVGGGFFVLLPLIIQAVHGGDLALLGGLLLVFWTGALIAAAALSLKGALARPGRALLAAMASAVVSFGVLATEPPLPALGVLVFGWGAAAGVSIAMSRSIVQAAAPPEALARVLSVYQLGLLGGAPVGAAALGGVAQAFGPSLAALAPMIGLGVALIWLAVATPIVGLRHQAARDSVES